MIDGWPWSVARIALNEEPVGPSRFSPADDPALDEFPGSLVPKALRGAPARIGQQIRAHVILAEKFDESVGRRNAISDEAVEAGGSRDHSKPLWPRALTTASDTQTMSRSFSSTPETVPKCTEVQTMIKRPAYIRWPAPW
jgi:hypothetical protein